MIFYFIILGLIIGSFLNVVILRLPENKSISFPSSHCPKCKNALKFYHNIPVLSWIFLGGKCAFCKDKISLQYPLIELLCGLIFAICYIKIGDLFYSFLHGLIFCLLLALSVIDLRYKAVPDSLSIPTLVLSLFSGDILMSLKYALMFAGAFALLRILVSFLVKKEALGEADIIIAAIIGAMLFFPLGVVGIYISAVVSLIAFMLVRKKGFELPFIPFLAFGLFVSYIFDEKILEFLKAFYA